jgi:coenzyme F420 biosynthesis associated uncharacterized protein
MAKDPIDWAAAVRSAQRRVPRGPIVTAAEAAAAVADLRSLARRAEGHVRETTGLGLDLPIADAEVVDRRGWIAAAAEGMAELTKPLTDALIPDDYRGPSAGAGLGRLLAYLSARGLGQDDPVGASGASGASGADGPAAGRLLLVAPNVVKVEREIEADPADFRLWVCLHESTHRLQFSAVDWMTGYFRQLVADYAAVAPTDAGEFLKRAARVLGHRGAGAKRDVDEDPDRSAEPPLPAGTDTLLRRIQTPEQRRVFDRLMALMTLLEGHADVVMDAVGPAVVPSVEQIRASFTERRLKKRGPIDRLLRSALGMDAKMAQYARGAEFVRGVTGRVGMTQFNAVFQSPETLPTLAEIADPGAWVRRVHG